MNNTLTPVQGCLIKLDVNGELRYGIVSQIKNEETGMVKPMFKQSEASFLHDDSLFASSICSWILKEIPDITNFGYEKPNIGFNSGIYNRNF